MNSLKPLVHFILILVATLSVHGTEDLEGVRGRFDQWLLGQPGDFKHAMAREKYRSIVRLGQRAQRNWKRMKRHEQPTLYDTSSQGPDSQELRSLVTFILPSMARAYQLPPGPEKNPYYQDADTLRDVIDCFEYLHQRGFRKPMQMPWKVTQIDKSITDQAIVVDFHLRVAGYSASVYLMRHELKHAGLLQRSLETADETFSHTEKTGDLRGEDLGADGIRLLLHVGLPYYLAKGDLEGLALVKRQVDRSSAVDYDCSGTIKPDGLTYHHRGVYLAGYGGFALAQTAQLAWLLRETPWQASRETIANLRQAFGVMRIVANKYDMHRTLGGRLREIDAIPHNLLGYAYLCDLDANPANARMFARLADPTFVAGPMMGRAFSGHRNETSPGPGAVAYFFRTLDAARKLGAEPDPQGNWALNYAPMMVHRRQHWKVSLKGYSKYHWAFERSIVDARFDARLQNTLGFHDSAFSLRIYGQGTPINAYDSGYRSSGWDWCKIPGATTRLVPPRKLPQLDILGKRLNRPYAISPFCGGVSLSGQNGVFAQAYNEVGYDQKNTVSHWNSASEPRHPPKRPLLRAEKSAFFFDDFIVCLTTDVRNGDGTHPVGTTLFQTALPTPNHAISINGELEAGVHVRRLLTSGPQTLSDAVGNGYYIPDANGLIVTRGPQTAPGYDGSHLHTGNFATAWIDHGSTPDDEDCQFVILPNASPDQLAAFARTADENYRVLQANASAHVVHSPVHRQTGYAIFKAGSFLEGPLRRADQPVLVMTDATDADALIISVCDPDHHWVPEKHYRHRRYDTGESIDVPPIPVKFELVVNGRWSCGDKAVKAELVGDQTVLSIKTTAATGIQFRLVATRNK